MRRRTFVAAVGGVGAALGSAGCTSLAQSEAAPTTPTGAQNGVDGHASITEASVTGQFIHVGASGAVDSEPDEASVSVAIEATGEDAEGVRSELADRAEILRDALLEFGLDEAQITTGRYAIREDHRDEGRYRGTTELRLEVDDIDRVGPLIDAAVAGGADTVGRIVFTVSDATQNALREAAIELALENAHREAEIVANARDLTLAGVQEITTDRGRVSTYRTSGPHAEEVAEADAPASTQIDRGPVTVSASVEVTYRFEA
ncbi:MAG: SIMPL domain-containing protein [Halobacteriota archaeon]